LWSSFLIEGARHTVYFGADTGWWEGLPEIGRRYPKIDLVMLEIGAYHELWKEIHLGPDKAVEAMEQISSEALLMPIHWGLFDLALHAWRQPIERVEQLRAERSIRLFSPGPGKPTEVRQGIEVRSDWWRTPTSPSV
jgi:L-ascorbate metabolism protein UlaG (beta-lactamase superfamily)